MPNLNISFICFWACYFLVTLVGICHTIFNIYVLHLKPMNDKGMGEAYEKTKPFHPLYNIILFPIFGFIYLTSLTNPTLTDAIFTGLIWLIVCLIVDIFGWVIIKHPWSLTFKEFYIDYQPWITLIYLAIFFGPIIGFCFIK